MSNLLFQFAQLMANNSVMDGIVETTSNVTGVNKGVVSFGTGVLVTGGVCLATYAGRNQLYNLGAGLVDGGSKLVNGAAGLMNYGYNNYCPDVQSRLARWIPSVFGKTEETAGDKNASIPKPK